MKIAPHIAHNEKLYKEFMDRLGNPPLHPRVSQQISSVQINPIALSPWGYNPSIIRHKDRLFMAYRWHEDKDYRTSLAIAELDGNLNVKKNCQIDVKLDGQWESVEDPRLFLRGDELWMSFTVSNWPSKQPRCVVQYGRLVEGETWTVADIRQPKYGHNDGNGLEKNWVFFDAMPNLSCFYSADKIIELNDGVVVSERVVKCPQWLWGAAKGGTAPMSFGDDSLRFFHSSLDFEPRPYRRRYYLGAMTFSGKISKKPIAIGSEADDIDPAKVGNCLQWKPKVVFPGGAIEWEGGWLCATGINDCECLLLKVKPEDLHL